MTLDAHHPACGCTVKGTTNEVEAQLMNWSSSYQCRVALAVHVAISPDTPVLLVSKEGTCCSLNLLLHVQILHISCINTGCQYR